MDLHRKEKLYLDTSVFSAYYDKRALLRQHQTIIFWDKLTGFQKYVSSLVIDELGAVSDKNLKSKLLGLTKDFKVLKITEEVVQLAEEYVSDGLFPAKYFADALHLSVATVNEVDVIISWNFEHFVKRKTRILANLVNSKRGYKGIDIIAPPEL